MHDGKNRIIPCRVSEFLRFFFLHRRPSPRCYKFSTDQFFFLYFFFVNPKYRNVKSTVLHIIHNRWLYGFHENLPRRFLELLRILSISLENICENFLERKFRNCNLNRCNDYFDFHLDSKLIFKK